MNIYYKIKSDSHPELDILKFANQHEVCEYIKDNQIRIFEVYRIETHLPSNDGSVTILPIPPSKTDATSEILEMMNATAGAKFPSNQLPVECDAPSFGLNLVSLLFPLIGIILFFCKMNKSPRKAKSCLIYAGIGFAINILYYILF